MKNPVHFLAVAALLIAVSCNDADCKNANPVFDNKTADTKEYQEELAKALESDKASATVFTLDRYEEKDGIPHLYMSARRKDLCATAIVLVLNPDSAIKNVQKAKGEGYEGAEFKDFKYKIFRDEAKTVLLYESASISD